MSAEQLFSMTNGLTAVGWVFLAVSPRWPRLVDVAGRVFPAIFAALYITLLVANWNGSEGGFTSLAGVAQLFANPWLLLAGWLHYAAFDLFVGAWEVRDARERGVRHALVVPCLLLTAMLGPAGWLLYLGVRSAAARR